jgi:hypothetical protein
MSSGFQARPNAGVRHPLVEVLYGGVAANIALGRRGGIGPESTTAECLGFGLESPAFDSTGDGTRLEVS